MTSNQDKLKILLYIPNLIGYFRIFLLLLVTFCTHVEAIPVALFIYIIFALLDMTDGWAARKFNQCSAFGAWLDVVVDNMGRTLLWTLVSPWGFWIASVEWLTFVCNHSLGPQWKKQVVKENLQTPRFVSLVMVKGFKTPLGALVISGIHVLPIWMYAIKQDIFESIIWIPNYAVAAGIVVLLIGRLLGMACEMWCIWSHVKYYLLEEK